VTTGEDAEQLFKGLENLLDQIRRCVKADAMSATAVMIYVCIDAMGALARPAAQKNTEKKDFIQWVDEYLKADVSQPYQYRGIDLYAARCGLLHTFGAEADAHRKDPAIPKLGYHNHYERHVLDPTVHAGLVMISLPTLISDLGKALERFNGASWSDVDLRERVSSRLPTLLAEYPGE
jgi:hypothetical protein